MFVSLVRLFALIRHLYSGLGLQSVINLEFDIIHHTSEARQIALQWIGVNKRHCANLWIGLYTVDNC